MSLDSVRVATRPNFFIVGAPRSGTTALYDYLQQHPDVFLPYRKEPHYFGDDIPPRPPYLDERSYVALFSSAGEARRVGEATVWYLYSRSAAEQINAFAPEARIVIMLRRPAEMLYSLHGLFLFTTWEEIADFGEALAAEPDRRAGRRLPRNTWWPQALQYRWLGDYAPHVADYLEVFGRERVKVIVFDDFRADTARVVADTFAFLEVDAAFVPRLGIVNRARTARSMALQRLLYRRRFQEALAHLPPYAYHVVWRALMRLNIHHQPRPPLPADVNAMLTADLEPAVARLEELLGRSLEEWRRVPTTGGIG